MAVFYLDVDGVLTDGTFLYDSSGKSHKVFGAEDSDALKILSEFIDIEFLSADHRGIDISRARVERDMGFTLHSVPARNRLEWLKTRHSLAEVVYMGDGFTDAPILRSVLLGICPQNGSPIAHRASDFVTQACGGRGAVAEACFYVAQYLGFDIPEFLFDISEV
jgi:3-deoxy-D-manno-octulosonate 8-phosphate phosphatase (KDO 8-P phosphatase)